jgi:hypothetical protein
MCSWWWVVVPPETSRAVSRFNNSVTSHLVWYMYWNILTKHGPMNVKSKILLYSFSYEGRQYFPLTDLLNSILDLMALTEGS